MAVPTWVAWAHVTQAVAPALGCAKPTPHGAHCAAPMTLAKKPGSLHARVQATNHI
jgi:hypothetical protein